MLLVCRTSLLQDSIGAIWTSLVSHEPSAAMVAPLVVDFLVARVRARFTLPRVLHDCFSRASGARCCLVSQYAQASGEAGQGSIQPLLKLVVTHLGRSQASGHVVESLLRKLRFYIDQVPTAPEHFSTWRPPVNVRARCVLESWSLC